LLFLANGFIDWPLILGKTSNYLIGHPDLNTISWFLICLFIAEIFAAVILPSVDGLIVGLVVSFIFLRTGLVMTSNFPETVESLKIEKNFWYIHEAVVAFGLYSLGYSTFKLLRKLAGWKLGLRISLLSAAVILALTTFNLNRPYEHFVVIMKNSNHGNNWLFLLTAISGTLAVILIATMIPSNKILKFIGQNSLVFLCTSGIFHHFINPVFVKIMIPLVSESWLILLSFLFTLLTLIASIPIVMFLKKYTPQLVGIPQISGPWLPALISLDSSSNHLAVLDE
jgi:acyltransferase